MCVCTTRRHAARQAALGWPHELRQARQGATLRQRPRRVAEWDFLLMFVIIVLIVSYLPFIICGMAGCGLIRPSTKSRRTRLVQRMQ